MKPLDAKNHETRKKKRAILVSLMFSVCFVVLGGRAIQLQAFQHDVLTKRADNRFGKTQEIVGKRGAIYDRKGKPLAVSVPAYAIGLYTRETSKLKDISGAARKLGKVLSLSPSYVKKGLLKKRYNWLKRPVTVQQGKAIEALKIPGVCVVPFHDRVYPGIELAGQLIGFSDIDDINGLSGIEVKYNTDLVASSTRETIRWDGRGRYVEVDSPRLDSLAGDDVTLTIDGSIQAITESALEKAVVKHKAVSGMAVVMRPKSGEVLAMANYPSFNPNNPRGFSDASRINRGVIETFEPGSTMKVFLAAAALDSGKVDPKSIFYCENGSYNMGGHTVNDTHKYEWLSLSQVIKFSSNIGAVKISEIIGRETLQKTLDDFGFGEKSGINLPGESRGIVRDFKKLYPVEFGAVAFGQGISVTAVQLATAFGALANDGVLVKPFVTSRIASPSGEIKSEFSSPGKTRVVRPETARFMKKIMATVTQEGGTGTEAALDGYTVCGKTGTAQKIGPDGSYFKDRYIASFAGFVPMERPELVIVVVVDDPRTGGYYGGVVAGPAFREIAYKSLEYLHVAPENRQSIPEKLLLALKSEDKK